MNTPWDVAPSNVLGENTVGHAADYGLNFMTGGILARDGKPLDDHTFVSGISSTAQIGWKAAGFLSGLSKKALFALIASGWSMEQAVHILSEKRAEKRRDHKGPRRT
jgi:hypothetical protein